MTEKQEHKKLIFDYSSEEDPYTCKKCRLVFCRAHLKPEWDLCCPNCGAKGSDVEWTTLEVTISDSLWSEALWDLHPIALKLVFYVLRVARDQWISAPHRQYVPPLTWDDIDWDGEAQGEVRGGGFDADFDGDVYWDAAHEVLGIWKTLTEHGMIPI